MNKLLLRQLQKHFGNAADVPEDVARLLHVISESYDHYEKDRKLIERSIELSSKEMIELNSQLKRNENEKLNKAHKQLKTLFENIDEVIYSVDMISSRFLQISSACEKVYGYIPADFLADGELWYKVIHPADKPLLAQYIADLNQGNRVVNQYRIIHSDGSIRWLENKIIPTLDETGRLLQIDGVTNDISERKRAEKELEESVSILEATIESTADGILVVDFNGRIVRFNTKFAELWRIPQELLDLRDDEKATAFAAEQLLDPDGFLSEARELYFRHNDRSFDILKFKDGRTFERYSQPQLINGNCVGRVWSFRDITERTQAEADLIKRDGQLIIATRIAKLGYWEFDVITGLFTFDDQFYSVFRTTTKEIGKNEMRSEEYAELFVHPDDRQVVGMEVGLAIDSPDPYFSRRLEHRIIYADGEAGWISVNFYIVKNEQGQTIKTFGVNQDITERKEAEEAIRRSEIDLEIKNKQLEQKNRELEQFAYVASHDMQEPLRTTSSFVELLLEQYHGKLDERADKYLTYILQASDRMKILIKDLLDYSRIGRQTQLQEVDCNIMLQEVLADIDTAIKETGAEIKSSILPVISGYPTEIKQLFQNLLLNAIKFRKEHVIPQIIISAIKKDGYWQFSFADNGIGIAVEHSERIFIIFQRLHTRTEYPGSGIGLSHCKKIVELHKGRIWMESMEEVGSVFYFTLPAFTIGPSTKTIL